MSSVVADTIPESRLTRARGAIERIFERRDDWVVTGPELPLRLRLLLAIAIGFCAFSYSFDLLEGRGFLAGDFTWPYRGAQRLLAGEDPFNDPALGKGKPYPLENQLPYPMPAVLTAIPFSYLSPYYAGAIFFGLGSGLLAFGILTRREWHRLLLFLSPSFVIGAMVAQWPPLVMAAVFLPWLQPLTISKPNLGVPVLTLWAHKLWFIVAVVFGLVSLAINPLWPYYWLRNTQGTEHYAPLMIFPGILMVLALLRWRTREGKMLIWLSFVPQFLFFYDQLMLWLIPRTLRQSLFLLCVQWFGIQLWSIYFKDEGMAGAVHSAMIFVVLFFYLPALALVLRLPQSSPVPDPVRRWFQTRWATSGSLETDGRERV